jgi:hypothetical protein
MEMSGFFKPAASKMSITLSDEMARETICRMASSNSSGDFLPPSPPTHKYIIRKSAIEDGGCNCILLLACFC